MPSTEERELEQALEEVLGRGPARTLMSRLLPAGEELARQRDVDARFDAVDVRFDAVDARFDAVDVRFDAIDVKLAAMDMKIDALDVKFEGRLQSLFARTVMANLAFMITLTGVVLAAVRLG